MQFNSFIYILAMLPITLVLYFLANRFNHLWGKLVLIGASLVFLGYHQPVMLLMMGISCLINYLFATFTSNMTDDNTGKLETVLPVVINIGILIYFKYTNFMIEASNRFLHTSFALKDIFIPVGISFVTFQQIAYLVAVRKGELKSVSLVDYLVYILYFPKLLMGPLAEPEDFISQLNEIELKTLNTDNLAYGIRIFSYGLFKKVFFADTFAKAVAWGFSNIEGATAGDWMLIMLFYTLEIYFDFSGYSDMATGSSLMFNITLPINFDSPYKAVSIRDFWKRWHISLTKFFTKYVYIPLGGSRRGRVFTIVNTMLVFVLSGIWHGANWTFILWGILNGLFCVFDREFEKPMSKVFEPFRWLLTFIVVNCLWLLFASGSIGEWRGILGIVRGMQDMSVSAGLLAAFDLPEALFITNTFHINNLVASMRAFWLLFVTLPALVICFVPENNYRSIGRLKPLGAVLAAFAFVLSVICLSSESIFVYFNF